MQASEARESPDCLGAFLSTAWLLLLLGLWVSPRAEFWSWGLKRDREEFDEKNVSKQLS